MHTGTDLELQLSVEGLSWNVHRDTYDPQGKLFPEETDHRASSYTQGASFHVQLQLLSLDPPYHVPQSTGVL